MKTKKITFIIKPLLSLLFVIVAYLNANAQAVVSASTCQSLGAATSVSLITATGTPLTSIQSGLDFNLNLQLPGGLCAGGTYLVSITTSANMGLGTQDPARPFGITGANTFGNGYVISADTGRALTIPFKFAAGTTCNNELGTFDVTVTLHCNGSPDKICKLGQINLKAMAQSYWQVEKRHVWGNLRGGTILWDIVLTNGGHTPGIGDLNIYSGSIQDSFPGGTIISVSGASASISGSTATWGTGAISSLNTYVVYHVVTTSCAPAGTIVKNCANYNFCFGKKTPLVIIPDGEQKEMPAKAKLLPTGNSTGYQMACLTCASTSGQACATDTLVGTAVSKANFVKVLTYPPGAGSTLNYAPGCQAEYTIAIANTGNVPMTNIVLTDNPFPPNIIVNQITVTSTGGASVDYTTNLQSGTFNTGTAQTWYTVPPNLLLTTTSTSTLYGGIIYVKIKFTINAPANTIINNCATLNFSGTYGAGTTATTDACGDPLPALPASTALQSCVQFKVQPPAAIPGITKCIISPLNSFAIGQNIPFRIIISNHGSGTYSGNLTDLIGPSGLQNLSLVPGSVMYSYGVGSFNPYSTSPGCMNDMGIPSATPPSFVSVTQQTTQNLGWSITNMPGNCDLDSAQYLIIDFKTTPLPQSAGAYINYAKLGNLSAPAYYNITRTAEIVTKKEVSSAWVEPGQTFNYVITVTNAGSVALKNIKVSDALPPCVTYNSVGNGQYLDVNGAVLASEAVTGTPPVFSLPSSLILQPGQSASITLTVQRKPGDKNDCCNSATGSGVTNDPTAESITSQASVCVKSSLCCQISNLDVTLQGGTNASGGIVPVFIINSGTTPIQEVEISLIDYHAEYNNVNCKPANMGNLTGHILPCVGSGYDGNNLPGIAGSSPVLPLQTVITPVNSSLLWSSSTAPVILQSGGFINLGGLVMINFVGPDIVPLDCCSGTVYYCFKVRVKDVNCNVCEKIVCGSSDIPKPASPLHWTNDKIKDQVRLQQLQGDQGKPAVQVKKNVPAATLNKKQ